jgi:hypothetical protein
MVVAAGSPRLAAFFVGRGDSTQEARVRIVPILHSTTKK